ncbi:hypothetical protein OG923_23795 [Streptomyces halstedii]|uniref:hypothetical protein n=1 Tax=Streptomyces halstedii TaxID=1944 RepID=UPI0032491869
MNSSKLSANGAFVSRKRDGSVHIRRKGTVLFGWITIALISPAIILMGLAEVEEKGFHGIWALLFIGGLDAVIIRAGIRGRVILDQDGFVRDVSPLFVTSFPSSYITSITCKNSGLFINVPDGTHGVWSFAPSLIGGRSAGNARKVITQWLAETRNTSPAKEAGERKTRMLYVTLADVFFLAMPFIATLLV